MMRSTFAVALVALAACSSARAAHEWAARRWQSAPGAMHDRYDGKWFRTMTFVQRTTQRRPDGTASRRHGTRRSAALGSASTSAI